MHSNFTQQSTLHAAIIMDGNGRWALARGLPRAAGHRAGVETVSRIVEAAPGLGIGVLTLFAFSSDNWRRPSPEVDALMALLWIYLAKETPRCVQNGIRMEIIGRRDRLEEPLRRAIQRTEAATAHGRRLRLRMAVDYSAREAILAAAQETTPLSRESLSGALGPPVDLLIRTGGEQRLSDFLLWECAYAEFVFSRRMWPEYGADDLAWAVREFRGRQRRFGAVPQPTAKGRETWLE
ncbi:MAG: di-trans,poly-cis-decaprenylcistransferase [Bryobacteraceae bacterium]|jgi:undecaprenyl diphosphate synthase